MEMVTQEAQKQKALVIGNAVALKELLEEKKTSIAEMLPQHVTPERLIKMALLAASRQPKLYECTKLSIIRALMDSAELGLDFSGQLGTGYLIPFWNKEIKSFEATFMPGWRGLRDLALRSPDVLDVEARVVYDKDEFAVEYGLHPVLEHKPYPGADRGSIKAAYMIVRFKAAPDKFELMWADEIEAIHLRSKASDYGPWKTDYSEMARKTVTKRGLKWVPLPVETQEALVRATAREDDAFGLPEIGQASEKPAAPLREGRMGFGAKAEKESEQKAPETTREGETEVETATIVDEETTTPSEVPGKIYPNIDRPHLQRSSKRSRFIDKILETASNAGWPEEQLQEWLTERMKGKTFRELKTEQLEDLAGEIEKEVGDETR